MNLKKGASVLLKITAFVVVWFIAKFLFNEYKAYTLAYGKKANEIRISANIPTIKSFMYSKNVNKQLLGNQWVSVRKEPKKGEVLHIWKLAIPEDESGALYEESDAFRKKDNNGTEYQLNLYSTIENNIIIEHYGILTQFPNLNKNRKKINGIELDSLISEWKIFELN
ncbi:hypothetical protein HSX10_18130 [Winogradskyella undariae]|uniref:hypothetical protein n=1 Tax=Winogradskyella undariae TaxID=1285465 RepID=UPI00156B9304|nr:hypothetical protein [Winogradskyella undariae]NRR93495.1 hypothetical protein [Winogradskyella undariae]